MSNITPGQHRKNLELLEQQGVDSERYQTLLPYLAALYDPAADLSNLDAFRAALKLGTATPDNSRIVVDYGQSLEAMIAAGAFDWKNSDITAKRFPLKGKGRVEFEWKLVHPDEELESDDAKTRVEKDGWQVGGIEHLLAFWAKFPEKQRKYPIIALGSVVGVDGGRRVAGLFGGSCRDLDLGWWGSRWLRRCRFLVVRKVSAS